MPARVSTADFISMLGPIIRAPMNPRGLADPEGKLAELEALIEEERRGVEAGGHEQDDEGGA